MHVFRNNGVGLYSLYLGMFLDRYQGRHDDEIPEILNAFSSASKDELDQYDDASIVIQQVGELWKDRLQEKNRGRIFHRPSPRDIVKISNQKREQAELRLAVYFGKLLTLDPEEEEITLFLTYLTRFEQSLCVDLEIADFADGFMDTFEQYKYMNDRYEKLDEYCKDYSAMIFPECKNPNPRFPSRQEVIGTNNTLRARLGKWFYGTNPD